MVAVDIPEKTFLHLLGKTGAGRSSTGNSILGRKSFKASASSVASTLSIQSEQVFRGPLVIEVVDGPGLVEVDTGFSHSNMAMFKKICTANPNCGHVFLLVCRYGERFTAEDSQMVKEIQREFGCDVFCKHGIVLITHGDNFNSDFEDKDTSFESWYRSQGGDFGRLASSCGHRVLLVDNSTGLAHNGDLQSRIVELMPSINYGVANFEKPSVIQAIAHALVSCICLMRYVPYQEIAHALVSCICLMPYVAYQVCKCILLYIFKMFFVAFPYCPQPIQAFFKQLGKAVILLTQKALDKFEEHCPNRTKPMIKNIKQKLITHSNNALPY